MQMDHRFSLDMTPEEAILLLTGARLLDKLVAGISIQASDRDELIKDVIAKLADRMPPALSGLSEEIAEAIVESVLGSLEFDEDDPDVLAGEDGLEFDSEPSPCNYPMYSTDKTLPVLEQAVISHTTVKAHYYSFARESVDVVTLDPLALVKENGLWKMVAYCHERDEPMLFRVDRIKELTETKGHFEVPEDINLTNQLPFAS